MVDLKSKDFNTLTQYLQSLLFTLYEYKNFIIENETTKIPISERGK